MKACEASRAHAGVFHADLVRSSRLQVACKFSTPQSGVAGFRPLALPARLA
ncbi:hypothetical protein [Polaromonas sp. CG9_12]|nr:hypothetical protein [Polaromonas sp. CG9_12]